jgi:predicted DNA-binding transcriptional regulator YafY
MRADRLLSLLILLQNHGSLTASALAQELEVSVRTIYRDVEALGIAGVPIYASRGPQGGIALLEDYRTNLTGLSSDEVRALSMLNIPEPLLQLGVGQELKAALLKLSASLPRVHLSQQQSARQRIHLDARWWGQSGQPGPFLECVQHALWNDLELDIITKTVFGAQIEQIVDPMGLVAKAGEWYLVARLGSGLRVFRISHLVKATCLEKTFARPEDFDLPAFWDAYCHQVEAERGMYWVELRISPGLLVELPLRMGEQSETILEGANPADEAAWRQVRMAFDSLEQARGRIMSFGGGAEVIEPLPLRRSIEDYAQQILKVYAEM